jgi:uncharacterized lipoprotein YmbA
MARLFLSGAPTATQGTPVPVAIGIGPIALPGYLDRPQVVVRVGPNELSLSESDRWAEPLAENVARTLEENLAGLLPGSSFVDYPWFAAEAPDFALSLDVRHFEADAGGTAVLDATWQLRRDGAAIAGRSVRIEEEAEGPTRGAAVAAQSRALAALSQEIAGAVRTAAGR